MKLLSTLLLPIWIILFMGQDLKKPTNLALTHAEKPELTKTLCTPTIVWQSDNDPAGGTNPTPFNFNAVVKNASSCSAIGVEFVYDRTVVTATGATVSGYSPSASTNSVNINSGATGTLEFNGISTVGLTIGETYTTFLDIKANGSTLPPLPGGKINYTFTVGSCTSPCTKPTNVGWQLLNYNSASQSYSVRFTYTSTSTVQIDYKPTSSTSWTTMSPNPTSSPTASIPGFSSGQWYNMRIKKLCSDGTESCWVYKTFRIPYITVTEPNSGDNWNSGSSYNIYWDYASSFDVPNVSVSLYYSTDGGGSYNIITSGLPISDGSYNWVIPPSINTTNNAIVKIELVSSFNALVSDDKSSVFSITGTTVPTPTYTISGKITDNNGNAISNTALKNGTTTLATTNSNGEYSFSVDEGWSGTVTPTSNCYTFIPNNIAYDNITSNQANQDYTATSLSSITISSPNGGENWTGQEIRTITWSSSCLPSSCTLVNIYLIIDEGLSSQHTYNIASSTSNDGSFSWTIPNTINSTNCKILIAPVSCNTPFTLQDRSDSPFTIKPNCTITCIPQSTRPVFHEAACGLVNRGILCFANTESDACLTAGNCIIQPDGDLTRQQWANMLYRALFGQTPPNTLTTDKFPTPFNEFITPSSVEEQAMAKVLAYLEYSDGVSVFRRRFDGFNPSLKLKNKFVLKALLEAYDISPDYSTTLYGMCTTDDMRGYVTKAKNLNLIPLPNMATNEDFPLPSFDPEANCTRREAIILLYRLIRLIEYNGVSATKPLDNQEFAFFRPANYRTKDLKAKGAEEGNMAFYTETPFVIPGLLPLDFGFTYNAQFSEIPGELFEKHHQPMGLGFSHTYHIYMIEYEHTFENGQKIIYYLLKWADGSVWTFGRESGSTTIQNLTQGLYDTELKLIAPNTGTFELRTKDQTLYTFEKKGSAYPLTKIQDRHNNILNIDYFSVNDNGCDNQTIHLISEVRIQYQTVESPIRSLSFSYTKDSLNRQYMLTKVLAPYKYNTPNRNIQFEYSQFLRLKKFTDAKGNITEYFYGKPTDDQLWDNNAPYTGDFPPFAAQLKEIKRPRGNRIKAKYLNGKLNQITAVSLNGAQPNETIDFKIDRTYENASNTGYTGATIKQGDNESVTKFDNYGQAAEMISNVSNNAKSTTNVTYYPEGHPNAFLPQSVNQDGIIANYEYDGRGNTIKTSLPLGIVHQSTFNDQNDLMSYTNPRNLTTTFQRNANGVVTQISPPEPGTESTFTPNPNGTIANATVGGVTLEMGYNPFGNLNKISHASFGTLMETGYEAASQVKSMTNALNQVRTLEWDKNDNLTLDQFQDVTLTFTPDVNDNLVETKNPEGGVTETNPNDFDQLASISFAGKTQSFTYRPEDLLLDTWTKQDGTQVKYVYESKSKRFQAILGYMAVIYYETGIHKGRIRTVGYKDNQGTTHKLEFDYDAIGRLESYTFDDTETVRYEYADMMNLTKITYPDGNFVSYTYDNNNRLKKVLWNGTKTVIEYFYNGIYMSHAIYGNGTRVDYAYNDPLKRLTGIDYRKNADGTGNPFASFAFTLDKVGRHTAVESTEPLGFINKPEAALPNESYEAGGTNRLTNFGGMAIDYNANNQISSKGAGTAQATTFGYHPITDYPKTLNTATYGVVYEQDALGHLRQATRNGTVTKYSIDLSGLGNILTEETNGEKRYYIYGMGMVARVVGGELQYYHPDFRGSTIAITNEAKEITHTYAYGDWGEPLKAIENGIDVSNTNTSDNRFRYVGTHGVMHEISEYYWMRARLYDSQTGRFTSEDKIWGYNLFGYADNDPIGKIDRNGKFVEGALDFISIVNSATNLAHSISNGDVAGMLMYSAFLGWDIFATTLPGVPSSGVIKLIGEIGKTAIEAGVTGKGNPYETVGGIGGKYFDIVGRLIVDENPELAIVPKNIGRGLGILSAFSHIQNISAKFGMLPKNQNSSSGSTLSLAGSVVPEPSQTFFGINACYPNQNPALMPTTIGNTYYSYPIISNPNGAGQFLKFP